jgi:hypothetical protein
MKRIPMLACLTLLLVVLPASAAEVGAGKDGKLTWTLPEGWKDKGEQNQMRYATLTVDGLDTAVSSFPGDVGGLHANLNRWRQQVGLGPVAADEVEKQFTKVELKGTTALVCDLQGQKRMLGAIVKDGDKTWFLKMIGDDEKVARQKEKFTQLIKSLKWTDGK